MQLKQYTKIALSNPVLKIISLVFGFSLWYVLTISHTVEYSFNVPLCFYSHDKLPSLKAPESVYITLQAHKRDFYNIDQQNLAVHINGAELMVGNNVITLTREHLFLPDQFKLIHYKPSNLTIEVQPSDESTTQQL